MESERKERFSNYEKGEGYTESDLDDRADWTSGIYHCCRIRKRSYRFGTEYQARTGSGAGVSITYKVKDDNPTEQRDE